MTVCSKPKSFKYGELERCASTSAYSNSTSMDSLCTFARENSNTTTTEEDAECRTEICSSASSTSLSLPSLSSEEEDWKQFGYLLDASEPRLDFDATVPYHQQFDETPTFMRSNSSPAVPEVATAHLKCDPASQLEISSLDVEVSSSTDFDSSASAMQCEQNASSSTKTEAQDDEPVAKRTRRSLATRDAMKDSLAKLSNVSKEEMISKFLQSSPKASVSRVHNVCRPWWHKKIITSSELPSEKQEAVSASEDENDENKREAFRRPKEFGDAPFGSRNSNPESQSKQKVGETIKLEPASVKQETDDPTFNEYIDAHKNLLSLDAIKSQPLSPSSHSADEERAITKASRSRKRPRPSPEKAKQSTSGRLNTPTSTRKQNRREQKVTQSAEADNEEGDLVLDPKKKHCSCGTSYDPKKFYLMCDRCRQWFHGKCVGITEKRAQKMDSWMCAECEKEKAQDAEELYCVCHQPYDESRFYVGCDSCEDWFHPECINSTKEEVAKVDHFICPNCRQSATSGNLSS
ncbi:PHD-finger domain-containing protein [Ditylenchus destructor]|uniref:PHD-finger domain-containing protein n=1 Tax=Ditylenchus destructor TaxID=166010 RepID=A0AAD4N8Y9_9BILA|nr:PHD-finger domain-containing protein [Ditylenchus destructor]